MAKTKKHTSLGRKQDRGLVAVGQVFDNCFFDPDEPGFIVKRVINAKIRLAPTLTDHIPWQVLSEHIQDTADILDRQVLNETLDRAISPIEYAAPEGTGWASPTPTKIVRGYGYVVSTTLKAIVGAFSGLVLLGCGGLMIMTILKAS